MLRKYVESAEYLIKKLTFATTKNLTLVRTSGAGVYPNFDFFYAGTLATCCNPSRGTLSSG